MVINLAINLSYFLLNNIYWNLKHNCILVFFHSFKTKLCGTLSDLKEDKIFFSYKFQAIADLG